MSNNRIRVGIIGLNPKSWAGIAHIPALKHLSNILEIVGVANTTLESAKAVATIFDIPIAFETPQALIQSPDIDLVVVTVKVPSHFNLVKMALEAGKNVYCEHPLGNGLEETQELARIAEIKGSVAVVGTQWVASPEIQYLKQLIAEGYIGDILSMTLVGSGVLFRDTINARYSYVLDKANGATMLAIPLGHTLAGVLEVLGDFKELSAILLNQFKSVEIIETGQIMNKTAEDQILVIGELTNGTAVSIHYRSGLSSGVNFLWEINGTKGNIQVMGPNGNAQLAQLQLAGSTGSDIMLKPLFLPDELTHNLPYIPHIRNTANVYKLLVEDIKSGSRNAPNFQDALKLQELLHGIELASASGSRFQF